MRIFIAVLIAIVLSLYFPAFLIDAIRNEDKEKAASSKAKACLCFAALVFILLLFINS